MSTTIMLTTSEYWFISPLLSITSIGLILTCTSLDAQQEVVNCHCAQVLSHIILHLEQESIPSLSIHHIKAQKYAVRL